MKGKKKPAKSPSVRMGMTEAEHRAMKSAMKGSKGMKKGKSKY